MELLIDQEFRSIIPPLEPAELSLLEESILEDGVRDAIITWNGYIVDGHNRYDICTKHSINDYRVIEKHFPSKEDVKVWIKKNQIARRNLPPYLRAEYAMEVAEWERNRQEGLSKREANLKQNAPDSPILENRQELDTIQLLANRVGIGYFTTSKIIQIRSKASEDQKAKLRTGDASINEIYKRIKRTEREADALKQVPNLSEFTTPHCDLRPGDFRQVLGTIEENSIDLIFTDPPYDSKHLHLWQPLSELGSLLLKPGGYLVTYSGQTYLPEVIKSLSSHLQYVWLGALIIRDGPRLSIMQRHIWATIKPILFFVKPPFTPKRWFADSFLDRNGDKEYHDWQQTIEAPLYFIDVLTNPGDTVLDPFLGAGTNALATLKLKRHFIGCDSNEACIAMTQNRITDLSEADV